MEQSAEHPETTFEIYCIKRNNCFFFFLLTAYTKIDVGMHSDILNQFGSDLIDAR